MRNITASTLLSLLLCLESKTLLTALYSNILNINNAETSSSFFSPFLSPVSAQLTLNPSQISPDISPQISYTILPEVFAEWLPLPARIVGGRIVERYVPFMAGLEQYSKPRMKKGRLIGGYWGHICGASIIGNRWLVTAAHCFEEVIEPAEYRIFYSTMTLIDVNQTASIEKIFVHQAFSTTTAANDIALIKLNDSLDLSYEELRRIALNRNYDIEHNTTLSIFGYGYGSRDERLSYAEGFLCPIEECKVHWPKDGGLMVDEKQFCMRVTDSDSGSGDSGGPVVMQKSGLSFLAGLVSFGVKHDNPNKVAKDSRPGVYTDVRQFIDWIEGVVMNNSFDKDGNMQEDILIEQFKIFSELPKNVSRIETMEEDETLYVKPMEITRQKDWDAKRYLKTIGIFTVYGLGILLGLAFLHILICKVQQYL